MMSLVVIFLIPQPFTLSHGKVVSRGGNKGMGAFRGYPLKTALIPNLANADVALRRCGCRVGLAKEHKAA
jgi:hypothetical protein